MNNYYKGSSGYGIIKPYKPPVNWQWQRELYVSFNIAFQNTQTNKKVTYYNVNMNSTFWNFLTWGILFFVTI